MRARKSPFVPGVAGLLLIVLLAPVVSANPLFDSDQPLPIVLQLPVDDLLRHRQKRPTVEGKLRYSSVDGRDVDLDVTVTTRGKSRLEQCRYPPLRVNLKKKQVKETLFEGQNKLKLVVPCRTTPAFLRYLAQEYAIYKAYNLLTGYSYRVRAVDVTFRDSNGRRDDKLHRAFFIESLGEVASRLDMAVVKTGTVDLSQLQPERLAVMTLFQYMIANTDWSARKGPDGESCCHNSRVIGPHHSAKNWIIVPYDFDQSGIINTSYAKPDPRLPIRRVTQRLYRGYCITVGELDGVVALFNERRSAINALFGSAAAKAQDNQKAVRYLDAFYETINDPAKRQKEIVKDCPVSPD